jgi:hypothetical protein
MNVNWYDPIAWGVCVCVGLYFGYKTPRDVEIESSKPVYFLLNADVQAAKLLVDQCEPVKEDAE